ncbi:MAG TPA: dTDP-4-dehydrorhamnose reductase [Anaerolineales bacterium]|jgi:dTDP-4-dehydrorhamnose reductase|nr:dTDP-4-dehydrorhamnose reductase [Anaerolineales bacterium]
MKIVLFGKSGQLGWELERTLPGLGDVVALDHAQLDLRDLKEVQRILKELKPNLIVNASAYTEVDKAEEESELAMKINALAPGVMAEMARKQGAALIHYSTDYVFDGLTQHPHTEDDPTNPLNVYGKSKLMGEEHIIQAGDAYLILRTSWVYSLRGNSFVNKVLGWARKSSTLRIVDDQVGNPTWARMLAELTGLLLVQTRGNVYEKIREQCGIYHLAGSGYTSRYEWAKEILANDPNRSEQTVQTLEPARTIDFPTPATRPLFSALDCTRFEKTFGLRVPPWNSTLKLAMVG